MVEILNTDYVQLRKIKCGSNGGWWFHKCYTCPRKFKKGTYRYEWRLKNGWRSSTFWAHSCSNCLGYTLAKYMIGIKQFKKALSQ